MLTLYRPMTPFGVIKNDRGFNSASYAPFAAGKFPLVIIFIINFRLCTCIIRYRLHIDNTKKTGDEYRTCSCNQSSQLDAAALEGGAPVWHIHSVLARFARL